jgi:DNA-binding PadR family transcriptional regulator
MGDRLTTTSFALLGLLSISPMSGYDLHQAVSRSIAHFWPISKTQVYAELARLEPLGLVDGTDVPQERLPDKRVFRLSPAGEEALDAWLAERPAADIQMRIPFLLNALLGHRRAPEATQALLAEVRAQATDRARQYAEFDELMAAVPNSHYGRITVLFGQKMAEAFAEWAEEATALLPERQHRIDPRRRPTKKAAGLLLAGPDSDGAGR